MTRSRHGEIWQEGIAEGQESAARAKTRHAEKRPVRQEGEEPQAGDCHRAVRGASRRRQGAREEKVEQELEVAEEHQPQEIEPEARDTIMAATITRLVLENMVLQAAKGIDVQEASNITFRNITVIPTNTNPVVDIINSDNLVFDNIKYKDGSQLLFRAGGDRTKNIQIKNTDASKAKEKLRAELGTDASQIKW